MVHWYKRQTTESFWPHSHPDQTASSVQRVSVTTVIQFSSSIFCLRLKPVAITPTLNAEETARIPHEDDSGCHV